MAETVGEQRDGRPRGVSIYRPFHGRARLKEEDETKVADDPCAHKRTSKAKWEVQNSDGSATLCEEETCRDCGKVVRSQSWTIA